MEPMITPYFEFGGGQTNFMAPSNPSEKQPLVVALSCLEDYKEEAKSLADVATLEYVDYTEYMNGKIEAAAIVILRTLVYLPRGPKSKLHSGQVILCIGAPDKALELASAESHGLHLIHVDVPRADEIADTVMGLILGLYRRTHVLAEQGCTSHCWAGGIQSTWQGMRRMRGMVLGLVGINAAGRAVAKRASAFGIKVAYYESDSMAPEDRLRGRPLQGVRKVDSLEALLAASDIVSLHCSLGRSKEHVINRESIKFLKQGSVLINASSSQLVEDAAVKEALAAGRLGGCALDGADPPAWMEAWVHETRTVLILPRSAHQSEEAWAELRTRVVRVARSYLLEGTLSEATGSDGETTTSEVLSAGEAADSREPFLRLAALESATLSAGGSSATSSVIDVQVQEPGLEGRTGEGGSGTRQPPAGAQEAALLAEDFGQQDSPSAEGGFKDEAGDDVVGRAEEVGEEGKEAVERGGADACSLGASTIQHAVLDQDSDERAARITAVSTQVGGHSRVAEGTTRKEQSVETNLAEESMHSAGHVLVAESSSVPERDEQVHNSGDDEHKTDVQGAAVEDPFEKLCRNAAEKSFGLEISEALKSLEQQIGSEAPPPVDEAKSPTTDGTLQDKFWEMVSLGRTLKLQPNDSPARESPAASQSSFGDTSLSSGVLAGSHLQSPASSMVSPQHGPERLMGNQEAASLDDRWKGLEDAESGGELEENGKEAVQPIYQRRRDIAGHIHWVEGTLEGTRREEGQEVFEAQYHGHPHPEDQSDSMSCYSFASSTWSSLGEDGRGAGGAKMESWPWGMLRSPLPINGAHQRSASAALHDRPPIVGIPASPNPPPFCASLPGTTVHSHTNLAPLKPSNAQNAQTDSDDNSSVGKSPKVFSRTRTIGGILTGVFGVARSKPMSRSQSEAKLAPYTSLSLAELQTLREGKVVHLRCATGDGYLVAQRTPSGWALGLDPFSGTAAAKFVIVRDKEKLGFRSLVAEGKLLQANNAMELVFVSRRFGPPEMWTAEMKNNVPRLANVRHRGVVVEAWIEPWPALTDSQEQQRGEDSQQEEESMSL